jgi:hypothetical protein
MASSISIKARKSRSRQAEVVAGGGEHGADAVAVAAFEVIAADPVLGLDVPMTGSTATWRRISRRIGAVTRCTWPLPSEADGCCALSTAAI